MVGNGHRVRLNRSVESLWQVIRRESPAFGHSISILWRVCSNSIERGRGDVTTA